jgi:hypothetical protein
MPAPAHLLLLVMMLVVGQGQLQLRLQHMDLGSPERAPGCCQVPAVLWQRQWQLMVVTLVLMMPLLLLLLQGLQPRTASWDWEAGAAAYLQVAC